jgi:hypothetical protein
MFNVGHSVFDGGIRWCVNFLRRLALQEKKKLDDACVSMLKSRAWRDMLPFSLCNKKRLAIRHMDRPFFPTLSIPS